MDGQRPAEETWQKLTREKLEEIESRIQSLEQRKHVLEVLPSCDCPTLDDCGRALRERKDAQPAS